MQVLPFGKDKWRSTTLMRMDKKEEDGCVLTSLAQEMSKTDKLLSGDIDWKGRWTEIRQTARQPVTSLSSTIHQNPRAHEYYPVFIKDWAPIEVIGVTRGAGPKPPFQPSILAS
jgi:hypothetical protein